MGAHRIRRRLLASSAIGGAALALALGGAAAAQPRTYDIPAESLSQALRDYGRQSGLQIIFTEELVRGRGAPGLRGSFEPPDALKSLLDGTGLRAESTPNGVVMIVKDQGPQPAAAPAATEPAQVSEVTVTGTNIRGATPIGSPLITMTQVEIQQTGAVTPEELFRKLPQNFSGFDGGGEVARTSEASSNFNRGAAVDLRSLGPQATLVLIDGHRLPAFGGNGEIADISMIPLSAIARVDIVEDGASATYGSDAIGGVVNFVLRTDFTGVEAAETYGAATRGGEARNTTSVAVGKATDAYNIFATYEFHRDSGLKLSRRDFLPQYPDPVDLLPYQRSNDIAVSAGVNLSPSSRIFVDGLYSTRSWAQDGVDPTAGPIAVDDEHGRVNAGTLNIGLRQQLGRWNADVSAGYAAGSEVRDSVFAGGPLKVFRDQSKYTTARTTLSGPMITLPAGDLLVALGAEYRRDSFRPFSPAGSPDLHRTIFSGFVEAHLPLVSETNRVPFVQQLTLSAAGRYDHYSDVGGSAQPKFGFEWVPARDVTLRGSYAKSYRAPPLPLLAPLSFYITLPLPNARSLSGSTDTLIETFLQNPNLRPERSTSWTIGVDLKPSEIPGFIASLTYYSVNYSDQISLPPLPSGLFGVFDSANVLGPALSENPSSDFVSSIFSQFPVLDLAGGGAGAVRAFLNLAEQNLSSTRVSGLEANVKYSVEWREGKLTPFLNLNYVERANERITPASAVANLLNIPYSPNGFRARGGVELNRDAWDVIIFENYTAKYKDTLSTPISRVSSWSTTDFAISWNAPSIDIRLNVDNMFDARPPFLRIDNKSLLVLGYDGANASPVGRFISLSVRKRW